MPPDGFPRCASSALWMLIINIITIVIVTTIIIIITIITVIVNITIIITITCDAPEQLPADFALVAQLLIEQVGPLVAE